VPVATPVRESNGTASAGRQVLSGTRLVVSALLWIAICLYGFAWVVVGGAISDSAAIQVAVRLLGVVLVCTSANVLYATVKRRAIRRAWAVNVAGVGTVVATLYLLLAAK
jgi:hypothetical protein